MPLPEKLDLEVVTPEGLLLHEDVDELIAPGKEGYFGVRPGHTPLFATLGVGALSYRKGDEWQDLTCFWGWCEVLPDRVSVLAALGERAEEIDIARAETALKRAEDRMKQIKDEDDYEETREAWARAVTRLGVARKQREHP
ncbi:MAG: F0F1 ATP synthase subunit epsilon [Acidobacteria bacterium]|nr:F0F1 ATP synthase subunit epsilon [Acidobacteriota bacterium]